MQRYLIAVFDDREHADAAVQDLQTSGISAHEISIVAGEHHHRSLIDRLGAADTPIFTQSNAAGQEEHHAARTGMMVGAEAGAVFGVLAGIVLAVVSGGGLALLVAGPIAAALGGAATGAAAGGLSGALIGMGFPNEQATALHARVHEHGAILVSLRAEEGDVDRIQATFNHHNVEDVIVTGLGGAVA